MTLKGKTIRSGDQQIGINALVYCEELKGSLSEEVEQGRKLKFDGKVQVQDIPLTGKRGQTKLFKARNKKRHNIRAGANTNTQNRVNVQHDLGVVQSSHQNLGGDEDWVIVNGKDHEISAIPRGSEVIPSKDLGLENEILTDFPDGCNRSHTIELEDEDLYLIVPRSLTFAEITNILDQAVKEGNCEELDKVVQKIGDYEGRSITLDDGSFKNFCSNQLNLDLQNSSDHRHIYSNVLLQYKFDQKELKRDYSVKELVLLAIAANDKLAEKYQNILFVEENLSLLPLLVSGQKYIETFVAKFHGIDGIYDKLKNQAIQLVELSKIGFFSAMALRKEQNLLDTVFVEYVLKDLEQVLKTSGPDSTYGVLKTASLVQNEEFITIVLGAFERYINEPTKKASIEELLKKSFATLLETAISQEHVSIVECLCKKCTENKGPVIQGIYKKVFTDNRVIEQLNKQIIKKIISGGTNGSRKEKAEKIYDLVLKAALDVGNIAFIEHLCKECAECSNDVIDYLNQKSKNQEFDEVYESILIALSNIGNEDTIVTVLAHTQIYQNVPHNEQVIRQVIQNILKSATHYSMDQEDYSFVKKVCYLCTEIDAVNVIFQEECKNFKSSIEKRIGDLEKENRLLQSEVLREYNYSYFPDIINGVAQIVHTAYDAYTEDQKPNEYRENVCSILCLMHIRDILQFSVDVQEYQCYERQDLWDAMYQTPGTFIIRKKSDNVADKLAISVVKSDILSENPEPESTGGQQPQKNAVDKGKNIMDNRNASTKHPISNNYKEGKMHGSDQDTKSIEENLSESGNVRGVSTATSDQPVNIDDEKKQVSDQPTAQMPLQMESGSEFEGKDDQRDSPSQKSSANGDEHSSSSSSFVKLPESDTENSNGEYVKVSPLPVSGSGSSFEDIESVPTSGRNSRQATTSDGSNKEASQPVEPEVSNPQAEESTAPLKTPEESEGQELASVAQNTETENDMLSIQPTAPESTGKEQAAEQTPLQMEGKSEFEGKRDSPSPESSASGGSSSSSFVNVSTSDGGVTGSSNGEYARVEDIVEDTALKDTGSPQDIQAEASRPLSSASLNAGNVPTTEEPAVVIADVGVSQQLKTLPFDSEPSGMSVEDGTAVPSVDGNKEKQTSPTGDAAQMDDDDDYGLSLLFSEDDNKNSQPVPSAPLVIQDNDAKSASRTPDENDPVPQNTKGSKWPIVAAFVLAIAGVALGVAIAVHLEMLAVGIAVGVCCLVAATVMCHYKWPSSFIENNQIEKVALNEEKGPAATPV
ncbi:MAG: hypothetical protein LKM43_01720 [Wolbachia endosymbiont of Penenirmus auritus]|nr:hypothetical protein [Wolbachia endosymbiont of Penenirmus auritus]